MAVFLSVLGKLEDKKMAKEIKEKVVEKKDKGPTKKEQVLALHKKGLTSEEIADQAETTINSVRWYLSKAGLSAHRAEKPIKEPAKEVKKK